MKLITEVFDTVELIEESVNGQKNQYITGVYMQAGIPNKNRRIYPESILDTEVHRYINEKVNNNRAYGELNHPESPTVDLKNACVRHVELVKEGKNWNGKSLVLNTPMGNIVKGLLEGGSNLGVSSRGMGSLKKNGMISEVMADFRLSTAADVVSDPSAPDAFVNGIMENVDWVFDDKLGWQARNIVEQVREEVKKNRLDESRAIKAFQVFLDRVKNVDIYEEGFKETIKGVIRREKAKSMPLIQNRRDYAMDKAGEKYEKGDLKNGTRYIMWREKSLIRDGRPSSIAR